MEHITASLKVDDPVSWFRIFTSAKVTNPLPRLQKLLLGWLNTTWHSFRINQTKQSACNISSTNASSALELFKAASFSKILTHINTVGPYAWIVPVSIKLTVVSIKNYLWNVIRRVSYTLWNKSTTFNYWCSFLRWKNRWTFYCYNACIAVASNNQLIT